MDKAKAVVGRNPGASRPPALKPTVATAPQVTGPLPPLFRKVDWLTLGITFLFVFIGYLLTLAPEMTLEDSGELATGSFYAGIPHPPGYPVWTLFTWVWTKLLPFNNVAWRVGVASAFSGALASGMLAIVVSRGSSLIVESIDDLKNIDRRWENLMCIISGFVAGTLLGFNGYMWSQAVIVEVYPLSVVSLMGVVLFLLRWVYAPHQHRYLYWAFFSYGICVNNHQSLLVIAMGVEVLVWLAEPKLGREMFFWNSLLYLAGLAIQPALLAGNTSVFVIFNLIGIASLAMFVWLCISTKKRAIEFGRDMVMLGMIFSWLLLIGGITHYASDVLPALAEPPVLVFVFLVGVGFTAAFVWLTRMTKKFSREWAVALGCGGAWLVGAAFYLYMPIAGLTDPPMQWGYPRTLEGFIHAITRGQYDKIHPTAGTGNNAFEVISTFFSTYSMQLWRFLEGLNDEFNFFYLLIALVVFLFYRKMKRRERVWVLGMVALFVCVGPFLVLLLNFNSDRQSLELCRVFLTSSHVFVAMFVGFGLTLLAASLLAHYGSLRKVSILGAFCALDFAVFLLMINSQDQFDPDLAAKLGFAKILCWLLAATCVIIFWRKGMEQDRTLALGLTGMFVGLSFLPSLIALLGGWPMMKSTGTSTMFSGLREALSADHYGLPVCAALLLVGGGLAVMICALAFRDRVKIPLAVTLVAFALMPSYSIMTHWFDNEQRGHYFGYWFGHDMFTPPFTGPDGKLTYDSKLREQALKGPNKGLVYPEMDRNTILFGGTDPGRFAPTYMIFCDSFIPAKSKPAADPTFDRRDVYLITQNALADGTYLNYLRAQYFRSDQYKYDSPFFQEVLRSPKERRENYTTNFIARAANALLDSPLTKRGERIEKRWRAEGVYPPKEIYIPTPEDSQQSFAEYTSDAARRIQHDMQLPNEPKQVRPGEGVSFTPDGKVSVSGQIAVMSINGLLTKVIFDHNPTNEFYVEESFPLDWMYPHLTPFGVIMKINRQPQPEITDDIVRRDHEFWSKYSDRLIGNWITYDTPVKEITDFAERVYLHRDFSNFKGDRKFLRDDQAQKAFSKLRSSIAGIYAWRLGMAAGSPTPPQYMPKNDAENKRMLKEADFAFRQAFAFCPYSPEAVFRYVNFLAMNRRLDDAILVAETCLKLDPYNGGIMDLVQRVKEAKKAPDLYTQVEAEISQLEPEVRANTNDFQKALNLAYRYAQLRQNDRAYQVLDAILNNPRADAGAVFATAQMYADVFRDVPKIEPCMERLVKLVPDQAEAWYNLAATKAALGKSAEALQALQRALDLNAKRLTQGTNQTDLRKELEKDPRFQSLRDLPEFKTLIAPK